MILDILAASRQNKVSLKLFMFSTITHLIEEFSRKTKMFLISKMSPHKFSFLVLVHIINTREATRLRSRTSNVAQIGNLFFF